MQRLLAIISAAAGAIVGVVKLVGLATGSQWLGDNWRETLGYVGATFFLIMALIWVTWRSGHRSRCEVSRSPSGSRSRTFRPPGDGRGLFL
jgi:hypothetical protein